MVGLVVLAQCVNGVLGVGGGARELCIFSALLLYAAGVWVFLCVCLLVCAGAVQKALLLCYCKGFGCGGACGVTNVVADRTDVALLACLCGGVCVCVCVLFLHSVVSQKQRIYFSGSKGFKYVS